nr:site-specific integrase [Nocardia mikamii]
MEITTATCTFEPGWVRQSTRTSQVGHPLRGVGSVRITALVQGLSRRRSRPDRVRLYRRPPAARPSLPPLFLAESRRPRGEPLSLWMWPKVVRRIAVDAGVAQFSTHTTRHLCLTDLARMGWDVHAIAAFAGQRHTDSTLRYIHLSGRDRPVRSAQQAPSTCRSSGPPRKPSQT